MLKVGAILTGALIFATLTSSTLAAQASQILLWTNGAPGALGQRPEDKPTLTPYLSVTNPSGAAVIVCPGGAYAHLAAHEGEPIAQWLNSIGIKSFVLKYRLGSSGYRHPAMLQDVQRAVRYVREHAGESSIDPSRIGIIGFSAGGHVASSAGTHFLPADSTAADPLDRVSSRPDLMMLIYPVITMGKFAHAGSRENLLGKQPAPELVELMSNEKQVNHQTPPTFLVHTVNDATVPVENSLLFADALREAGISFELHVFDHGPSHGYGLAWNDPVVGVWPKLCEQWLKRHGF